MRRTTLGKPDAVKPPVRFDEGRGWGRKLTTAVCLTPSPQPRLLYLAGTIQLKWKGTVWRTCFYGKEPVHDTSTGGEPNGAG